MLCGDLGKNAESTVLVCHMVRLHAAHFLSAIAGGEQESGLLIHRGFHRGYS